jgi:hypothetical protein
LALHSAKRCNRAHADHHRQLVIVVVMGIVPSDAASSVTLPYRDAELLAMDRWLGFERKGSGRCKFCGS